MLSVCSSNRTGTSVGDSVPADIKPFATNELKRSAIGFKELFLVAFEVGAETLLTLEEAGSCVDTLGCCSAFA